MTDKTTRVAVYARVSTQEQASEGTSLETQREQLEKYCEVQGWQVFRAYVDPGFSGKDGDRPGLKQLLADANFNQFSRVVVFKLDRLARNLRLLLQVEENLKQHDIGLASIKESIDTSVPIGRTLFQILGLVAEWERETIIERTKAGRIARYREGSWPGGSVLYGYRRNKVTRKLEIYESEARVVRSIYHQYANGKTLAAIADSLNSQGIPTRTKKAVAWRPISISNIVYNPAYKGEAVVNRHCHISQLDKADLSDAITINVPPIVSVDVWRLARDRVDHNKAVRKTREVKWLLQGLVVCGECGYHYKASSAGPKRYYRCRGRLKDKHLDGSDKCTSRTWNADLLEPLVWSKVEEIINDPNKLEPLIKDSLDTLRTHEADLRDRIQPVDQQLSEIQQRKARLADQWVMQNMDSKRFEKIQQDLDKEENRLLAIRSEIDPVQLQELERLQAMLKFWEIQHRSFAWNRVDEDGNIIRTMDQPHKIVLSLTKMDDRDVSQTFQFPTTRRELLDQLQVKLIVFHDRIEIKTVFGAFIVHQDNSNSPRKGIEFLMNGAPLTPLGVFAFTRELQGKP